MTDAVGDVVSAGETSEGEIFVAAALTEEEETGKCLKQFALTVEKSARFPSGQPEANQFFAASVLKKEVERRDMITSKTGVQEGQALKIEAPNSLNIGSNSSR